MIKDTINAIFNRVSYWKEQKLLLAAIPPESYNNKYLMIQLLGISPDNIDSTNEAKRQMWNYQINQNYMGDELLKNTSKEVLDDIEFARIAIKKYNRTYIYLSPRLKSSIELAKLAAEYERSNVEAKHNLPILHYMSEKFQIDHEISLMATTRNIENLQYAVNLKRNKYFILDMMNLLYEDELKSRILKLVDQDLFNDKRFVAKLGCYDNLCKNFQGDAEYVAHAAEFDLGILRKTEIFDDKIIEQALRNQEFQDNKGYLYAEIFNYIERFFDSFEEMNQHISNKKLLRELFWGMGESLREEFR